MRNWIKTLLRCRHDWSTTSVNGFGHPSEEVCVKCGEHHHLIHDHRIMGSEEWKPGKHPKNMNNNIEEILATRPELQLENPRNGLTRYKWRCGGTLGENDSGDIYVDADGRWVRWIDVDEMQQENARLKDNLATVSKTKADEMIRLSGMIDQRQEALGHISSIIEEKDAAGEDLLCGSTAFKSVKRWASHFLHNAEVKCGNPQPPI